MLSAVPWIVSYAARSVSVRFALQLRSSIALLRHPFCSNEAHVGGRRTREIVTYGIAYIARLRWRRRLPALQQKLPGNQILAQNGIARGSVLLLPERQESLGC